MVDIPDDLLAFLADPANRRLEFAPGGEVEQLELFPPDELSEEAFTFLGPGPWGDRQMHEISGIGLTKSCPNYQPEGIMVWFPSLGLYGSWDCDHHEIMVFPGIRWTDVMRRAQAYFNASWYPESVAHRFLQPTDGIPQDPNVR